MVKKTHLKKLILFINYNELIQLQSKTLLLKINLLNKFIFNLFDWYIKIVFSCKNNIILTPKYSFFIEAVKIRYESKNKIILFFYLSI